MRQNSVPRAQRSRINPQDSISQNNLSSNVAKAEFLCNVQKGLLGLPLYAEGHSPLFRDSSSIQYLQLARVYPPYRNWRAEKIEW